MTHERSEALDWSAMSLEEILVLAIEDEEDAQDYYRRAAEQASTVHTRRLLLELSEMERGHADTLRKELEELQSQRELEAGMAD